MDGLYEVSSCGSVRRTENQRILKSFLNHKGYPHVVMHKNGKAYSKTIHRLVAEAFIPNPDNLPQVNHIDANKENNTVDNLEWISGLDNMRHAYRNGCFKPFSENQKAATMKNILKAQGWNSRAVICLDKDGTEIARYSSITEAHEISGCNVSKIVACCKGHRRSTHGYQWKYEGDI